MTGFSPLRTASRGRLALLALLGPLAWLVTLAVIAVALSYGPSVLLGLAIAFGSFLLALLLLALQRWLRGRRERRDVA